MSFIVLFISFIIGIISRYLFNNPQSWTFELGSICYLAVGILSWGISHRTNDNIVFDMLYEKMSPKIQCILRIVSELLISLTAAILIFPSISYLYGMRNLTTQIIKIPRYLVFLPFTISFVTATIRSFYRFIMEVRVLYRGDFAQRCGGVK